MFWILEKCFKWKQKYLQQKETNRELIKCIDLMKQAQDELLKYIKLMEEKQSKPKWHKQ
jgi:hypothetical protein